MPLGIAAAEERVEQLTAELVEEGGAELAGFW
jgi:hypothetical protein